MAQEDSDGDGLGDACETTLLPEPAVDDGAEREYEPVFTSTDEVCGFACNTGTVTL
mgnify:CR=1 FL=1